MTRLIACFLLIATLPSPPAAAGNPVSIAFNRDYRRWELSNGLFRVVYEIGPGGGFGLREFGTANTENRWVAPPGESSSPIHFALDERAIAGDTPLALVKQNVEEIERNGRRLTIVLADLPRTVEIHIALELFAGHPVLRQRLAIRNLRPVPVFLTMADFLTYRFASGDNVLDVFHIDQWDPTTITSFQLHRESLPAEGATLALRTGADARDIAWFAFRDEQHRGIFAGLEFDGRAQLSLSRLPADGSLRLSAVIPGLHHAIDPGQLFTLPAAFLGSFEGDWDQAGFLTQRFTEAQLVLPAPADFPWVSWDSWGYGTDINEQILRENAEAAAKLGIELFVVDLGWARHIGDWRDDPVKFPGGLRAISDHVHRLGMRFGLHFAPAEAAPEAPVLQTNPWWTSSETDWYFGAVSLCLGNRDTREWIVEEAVRMIDAYDVDYIVQDGENMVKRCRRSDHSHHPLDSNYANSVEGINWVVREIQRRRPHVLWENCEDGGHMMTFQMVQQYVTSITNDASGALDARKGAWGATYPFSPRYTSRYMPEHAWSVYFTRSYMFGGPWHFMDRLPDMTPAETDLAAREIGIYKRIRGIVRGGQVFHLAGPPAEGGIDALEAYDSGSNAAVIVVTRDGGLEDKILILPQGLRAEGIYRVRYENVPETELRSGQELTRDGLSVRFRADRDAEIVYLEPQ